MTPLRPSTHRPPWLLLRLQAPGGPPAPPPPALGTVSRPTFYAWSSITSATPPDIGQHAPELSSSLYPPQIAEVTGLGEIDASDVMVGPAADTTSSDSSLGKPVLITRGGGSGGGGPAEQRGGHTSSRKTATAATAVTAESPESAESAEATLSPARYPVAASPSNHVEGATLLEPHVRASYSTPGTWETYPPPGKHRASHSGALTSSSIRLAPDGIDGGVGCTGDGSLEGASGLWELVRRRFSCRYH